MDTKSDNATNVGQLLGPKRRKQKSNHEVPKSTFVWKLTPFFRTYVAEIDKIMEERIPTNQSSLKCPGKRWWQQDEPTSASLGCQSTPTNDVISGLPDEILSLIVSMMSLRDAATTSVLSKRWSKLWRSTANLHFDVKTLFGHDMDILNFGKLKEKEILQKQLKYVQWVNKILEAHHGSKIDSLVIQYPLRVDRGEHVLRWIKFAAKKHSEKLYIHLGERTSTSFGFSYGRGFIVFPHGLFDQAKIGSQLRHLSLSRCLLKLPANFGGFASLVTLEILYTPIQQEEVDAILTSCSKLEWLTLGCVSPKVLKFMSHGNSPLSLKHLNVDDCSGLEEIVIGSTIKLVSLEYSGPVESLRIAAWPVRLHYRGTTTPVSCAVCYVLGKLAQEVTDLKTLILTCFTTKPDALPRQLAVFSKLRHLFISVNGSGLGLFEFTCSFLKAAPFLYKFELSASISKNDFIEHEQEVSRGMCCRHQHLKIVHLLNFDGHPIKLLLAEFLMKNADIKHMRIIRKNRLYSGDGKWLVPNVTHTLVRRRNLRQLLHGLCPANTKLKVV